MPLPERNYWTFKLSEHDLALTVSEIRRTRIDHPAQPAQSPIDRFFASLPGATTWRLKAACRGLDADLFFPERGESGGFQDALAVCESCPVREECLEYALEAGERYGIWGGLNEKRRRQLKRDRKAASAA